jgi:hypothetical protein
VCMINELRDHTSDAFCFSSSHVLLPPVFPMIGMIFVLVTRYCTVLYQLS